MELQKLKMLIKQKEGPKLDFKENLYLDTESEKKELAKDVIAIANSIGGRGHIILGIKDKEKTVVGINTEEFKEERIQQIISYRCDPPIPIRVETVRYENRDVGVITVFKSYQRPHQMRQTGAFYIRRGSTTDFARRDEIALMLQEMGIISNELIPLYDLDVAVLNKESVNKYLNKMGIRTNESTEVNLWNSLGIIFYDSEVSRAYPTIGGLLLFCDFPQRYLPHCSVKIIFFENNEKRINLIQGNIMDILHKSNAFIKGLLKDIKYPQKAILECIANAVVHRDYFDVGRDTVVYVGEDKVEISNPGTLPKGNNIYTLMRESNPSRRNNWLYQRLLAVDDAHQFISTGIGLQRVTKMFEGAGKVKFLNIEKHNLFKVILPGLKKFKDHRD